MTLNFLVLLALTGAPAPIDFPVVRPTRIVLSAGQESSVTITNVSQCASEYGLSIISQTPTGNGPPKEDTVNLPAFVFAPKRTMLLPGQTQVVRMRHQPFDERYERQFRLKVEAVALCEQESAVKLAVTVPVVLRQGRLPGKVEIGNVESKHCELAVELRRDGLRSFFGDVEVTRRNAFGETTLVGSLRGIAISSSQANRVVTVPLVNCASLPDKVNLRLQFVDRDGIAPIQTLAHTHRLKEHSER